MPTPNGLGDPLANPAFDDLVGQSQNDPVVAALIAGGYPVQPQAALQSPNQVPQQQGNLPVPAGQPPLQQMGGVSEGPITSPDQLPAAPPPTTPATAPPDAAYVPPQAPPLTPLKSGDVKGANAAQEAALNAETGNVMATELAKTNALAAHAEKRAQIYEGHAQAQQLIDEQYQRAREKARMDANAETAAWMRDLDKKVAEEPVPGRWWANQTKFGQVMYLMSLAFGAMAQAKNPNLKNIALEMITKETEEDMAEQRQRIQRQVEALKMKGQVIDQRLRAQIEDAKDDHTLLVSRLAMVQSAALERANAPGSADVRAAMAEAAQWAGQQRLTIAGERANRAYAEREGQLNRDAEMSRAMLTDKRDRDIAAANIQKDYDLAQIKMSAKDDPRLKNSVVLNPYTTHIRVVDANTGQPVATPLGPQGGLVVAKETEKEARQVADLAQDDYATMRRVSRELGKGDTLDVMLKRNPQLVSDLVKLGYGAARNKLDPNGRVTDKDFQAGLENAVGGDLDSLSGRIAAGAHITADTGKLKELVDKQIRDYPVFVSNRLGALVDAAIPGYEGNIRVDWSPKSVEIDKPGAQSSQEIDASYGLKTPLQAPKTIGDLENAQTLEKKGVKALPPYRSGSEDKVLKALSDFKGAMPRTIMDRAGKLEQQLDDSGDTRASLEVQQAQYKAVKEANEKVDDVVEALRRMTYDVKQAGPGGSMTDRGYDVRYMGEHSIKLEEALDHKQVPVSGVVDLAKAKGLTQLTGQDVLDIIAKAGLSPMKE
jgi:hypothetical protein